MNGSRLEIEREYLALLLNKPDLLSIIQIKPRYLVNEENQKILKHVIECYQENECININKIIEKHKDFNIDYFVKLYNDTFYYDSNWKKQLSMSEEYIIKAFKEDIIKKLNEKLNGGIIKYDEFMKKMKKLDSIILEDNTTTITKKELQDGISNKKARINFNNFEKLNDTLKMVKGDFLIIGATTGAGKSSFMLNLMNDLMTGFQCIYFNMEMSKSTIYKRIVSIKSGIPMSYLGSPQTGYQEQIIDRAFGEIEEAGIIIEHKANDIKQIKSVLMKYKDKKKHTVLFIDHIGLTKVDDKKSLYERSTQVAKELRQMCLDYDCTVISASQLNRTAYSADELSISMLKDSGEVENSASKVILLEKDKKKNDDIITTMKVNIVKNRDGREGYIDMIYDKSKQIFKEE